MKDKDAGSHGSGEKPDSDTRPPAAAPARGYRAPSRAGLVAMQVHYPKDVRDQLKILGIEQNTTIQGLLSEAINDLFVKYGKPQIAPRDKR